MSTMKQNSNLAQNTKIVEHESVGAQAITVVQIIGDTILLILHMLWLIGIGIYRLFFPVPKKSVKEEIVLITGTGHGIGKALALEYASKGATVVGWDVNTVGVNETVAEIEKLYHTKAYGYTCNIANRDEVMQTAAKVQKDVGSITILVNNAGIMPTHLFLDHTTEEIEKVMNINVMAHFWTLQAFLPDMMKNNHGHIVALSSVAGHVGQINLVPYSTSKFAVRGMMEALHLELRVNPNNQIKCTTIYPYMVNTGLCKRPVIRFKRLMPVLNTEYVAKYIVNAQRRNVMETSVPRHLLSIGYYCRILPLNAAIALLNFVESYLASDLS